ncbi:MAG TPA: ATP-grasp domain-containing protein [Enhygromyxa sp.]|nr:ATP-grasp domain-containing protein [Enhygromyxa sp.]
MGFERGDDLFEIGGALWLWTRPVGQSVYDFDFERMLGVRRPYDRPAPIEVVARIGAFDDYAHTHAELLASGLRLINSPDEHARASLLPRWYPLLADLTPESLVFTERPDPQLIGETLGWPIFMKGVRQTSRHRRALSIIHGPDDLERALDQYARDPMLSWQEIVCRRFEALRPVDDPNPERIPSSFEFRSFWWRGRLVGFGRYWWYGIDYAPTATEREAALAIASEAARRVAVPFLVVDVAQRRDGSWIVIECNDAQESGYAGVSPLALWRAVLESIA